MEAPATRKVVEALSADGADVRFVGGCVRDALLGRESSDIDLGTPDRPEQVVALLARAGIESHTVPRGIEHGTVTALAGGKRHEITTLRRDERTDGRHAEVAFTDDWREDAARRDFSFNAMSMTPDGTLHDYFGGQADLTAGRVRFVGDPARRIAEDHLRLLRFFRFFAWYGKGEPDAAALAACRAASDTIRALGRAGAKRDAEAAGGRSPAGAHRDAGHRRSRPTVAIGRSQRLSPASSAADRASGHFTPPTRSGARWSSDRRKWRREERRDKGSLPIAGDCRAFDGRPPRRARCTAKPDQPSLSTVASPAPTPLSAGRERFSATWCFAAWAGEGERRTTLRAMLETVDEWVAPEFP